jgi:hypothetical protein
MTIASTYSPDNLRIASFLNSVPSISIPLPSSRSPLDMASSVKTRPMGLVGVISPFQTTLSGASIDLFHAGCGGMKAWISGCALQSTPPGRTL